MKGEQIEDIKKLQFSLVQFQDFYFFYASAIKKKSERENILHVPWAQQLAWLQQGAPPWQAQATYKKRHLMFYIKPWIIIFAHFQVIYIPVQKRSCSKPGWDSTGWPRCNRLPEMKELGLVPGHHHHHHPDYHHNTAGRVRPRGLFDGSELVCQTTGILS